MQQHPFKHNFDVPVPQILKDLVRWVRLVPQERKLQLTDEDFNVSVPLIFEDTADKRVLVPQERVHQQTGEFFFFSIRLWGIFFLVAQGCMRLRWIAHLSSCTSLFFL